MGLIGRERKEDRKRERKRKKFRNYRIHFKFSKNKLFSVDFIVNNISERVTLQPSNSTI